MRDMNALRIWNQILAQPAVILAIMVAGMVGCKDATSQNNSPALNNNSSNVAGRDDARAFPNTNGVGQIAGALSDQITPKDPEAISAISPDVIYEPKVVLSASHEATCLVKVGDEMPELALKSLAGETVSLKELRGNHLTVVVFWTTRLALASEQFERLGFEVALPFKELGVRVVAVNVGDPVEQIELHEVAEDDVTCVLDPDGSATAKVATDKLPRTYLIDSDGRILWFDIGYSRTTRRQLKNAVFYFSRDKNDDPS